MSLRVDWNLRITRRSDEGNLSSGMSSGIRSPMAGHYGILEAGRLGCGPALFCQELRCFLVATMLANSRADVAAASTSPRDRSLTIIDIAGENITPFSEA